MSSHSCQPKHLHRLYLGCSEGKREGIWLCLLQHFLPLVMSLTCSRHKAADVNRRADSFQSLAFNCLAMDWGDWKVNSLIATLSSGDKLCTRNVGIYCSSQPTISTCLFWMGNGSSCQRHTGENRELIPANVAYAADGGSPSEEYGPEPNPSSVVVWNASCCISLINDIVSH